MNIDSLNVLSQMNVVSGLNNVCISNNLINEQKEIIIPNGFNPLTDNYVSIKTVFIYGHQVSLLDTDFTVKCKYANGEYVEKNGAPAEIPIYANRDGNLIKIPNHKFDDGVAIAYKYVQANTILEMYFDPNADSDGAFVIVGNPIVLSSSSANESYTIYANGSFGDEPIGTIDAIYNENCPRGWLPCDGSEFDRTKYSTLYTLLNDDHTPDLRNRTLMGYNDNPVNGNLSSVGDIQLAQLPNIKGWINAQADLRPERPDNQSAKGCFITDFSRTDYIDSGTSSDRYPNFKFFNASLFGEQTYPNGVAKHYASVDHLGNNVYYGDFDIDTGLGTSFGETRAANIRVMWIIKAL